MVAMNDLADGIPIAGSDEGAERYWRQLLVAALALGALVAMADDDRLLAIGTGVVAAVGIAAARQHRVLVAVSTALLAMVMAVAVGEDLAMLPIVGYACFYLAYHEPLRTAVPVGSGIAVALAVVVPLVDRERLQPLTVVGVISVVLIPLLLGIILQQQREQVRARVEAATAAHTEQERIRIARDLHDVVAHGLSTIAIQSGVAAHLIDKDPGQAKEALEVINATGKSSLEELRVMVGVLRSTDDAPLRPTPSSPDDLTDLLDGANRAGIAVTVERTGEFPPDVGDSCVVAMHRIIQEALTNIARHAGGASTTLRIEHSVEQVEINISNEGTTTRTTTPESTGVGIIGMRERTESLGGTLRAEPIAGGGFRVVAVLPYNLTRERT